MNEKNLGADAAEVVSAGSIASDAASHVAPTHTPGPWTVNALENINVGGVFLSDGNTVGRDGGFDGCVYMPLADAHLIAAAPELLEALKIAEAYVHLWMTDNTGKEELDDLERIEAAIAKAEGRS